MESPIFVIEMLSKSFGDLEVLRGMSLEIRRGETIAILGESGSGKSVIIKHMIGLLKPDAGRILFDGVDLVPLSEVDLAPFRRRMGFLFQGAALFDSLTVGENVAYPLREEGFLGEAEIGERVREKLELVGLAGTEEKMPADLSGGMRKRVGLARAIATNPEVIFYDEPTTGLDPVNSRRIDELIRATQAHLRATSIVVTHDIESAFSVSDRVAFLQGGRITAIGSPRELRQTGRKEIEEFIEASGVRLA